MIYYYNAQPIRNRNILRHVKDAINRKIRKSYRSRSRSPYTRRDRSRSRSRSRRRSPSDIPGTKEHRWKNAKKLWRNPNDEEALSP